MPNVKASSRARASRDGATRADPEIRDASVAILRALEESLCRVVETYSSNGEWWEALEDDEALDPQLRLLIANYEGGATEYVRAVVRDALSVVSEREGDRPVPATRTEKAAP